MSGYESGSFACTVARCCLFHLMAYLYRHLAYLHACSTHLDSFVFLLSVLFDLVPLATIV